MSSPALEIGGVADHIHILCRLSKTGSISELVRELKRDSCKWIHTENPLLADFYWQEGYGAFSISPGHIESLIAYIRNQEEHHKTISFQDEFRRLCAKYNAELDERNVWG